MNDSATFRPPSPTATPCVCCVLITLLAAATGCHATTHPAALDVDDDLVAVPDGGDGAAAHRPMARATASPPGERDPVVHSMAAVPTPPRAPAPVATPPTVDVEPRVIVTPRASYVLIRIGPDRIGTRTVLTVAYVAANDPAAATAPDSAERIRAAARTIFRALQVLTEMTGTEEFSVIALFGAPGEPGVAQQVTFTHGPDAWYASATPIAGQIESVPPFPIAVERDGAGERAAVDVALRFLGHVDRLELEAAWALSSPVFRATTSRASFEAHLRALHRPPGGERVEEFHSFAPGAFVPGTELDVLFARPPVYEAVMLRMDDDRTWRVAGLLTIGPDEGAGERAGVAAAL